MWSQTWRAVRNGVWGQPAVGAGDGLAHGGEGEAQPVGVAEPVDHQLPVIQAGVAAIARPAWWLPLAMLS